MNFAAAPLPASLTKQNSWLKSDTICRACRFLIFCGLIFCRLLFSVQHVQASRSRRLRPWSPWSVRAHVRLHRLQERQVGSSDAPDTEPQPLGRVGPLGVFAKVGIHRFQPPMCDTNFATRDRYFCGKFWNGETVTYFWMRLMPKLSFKMKCFHIFICIVNILSPKNIRKWLAIQPSLNP